MSRGLTGRRCAARFRPAHGGKKPGNGHSSGAVTRLGARPPGPRPTPGSRRRTAPAPLHDGTGHVGDRPGAFGRDKTATESDHRRRSLALALVSTNPDDGPSAPPERPATADDIEPRDLDEGSDLIRDLAGHSAGTVPWRTGQRLSGRRRTRRAAPSTHVDEEGVSHRCCGSCVLRCHEVEHSLGPVDTTRALDPNAPTGVAPRPPASTIYAEL